MSFLNPVNEPVLRFKSTDASAPQINYNSRAAGDVKAILKACLVTGYGTKPSAGWSIINEAAHVAEFVSPSAAMSDYRLGVNDTGATATTWYCWYQGTVINPRLNVVEKSMAWIDKTHVNNGWELIVSQRGIFLIEYAYYPVVSDITSRLTYWGAIKSGLIDESGVNIAFYNLGHSAAIAQANNFYSPLSGGDFKLGALKDMYVVSATHLPLQSISTGYDATVIDVISPMYLAVSKVITVAQICGALSMVPAKSADVYGKSDIVVGGRPMVKVPLGHSENTTASYAYGYGRTMLVYLDYLEY